MATLTNENWYYLYLEDGAGGAITIPPESTVDLPEYFLRYEEYFIRDTITGVVPTDAISIGAIVMVYANNVLDGEIGEVIDKDSHNYKIDFGTEGRMWFPFSEVRQVS